jgi:RNA-directed DNA polymerase
MRFAHGADAHDLPRRSAVSSRAVLPVPFVPSATELAAAEAVLAGPFTEPAIAAAMTELRGRPMRSIASAAAAMVRHFGRGRRLLRDELAAFLANERWFRRAFQDFTPLPLPMVARMQPASGAPSTWRLPAITTVPALARWLQLTDDELVALVRTFRGDRQRRDHRLPHYLCRWQPRRASPPRLLEAPKQRLKAVQHRIAQDLLAHVPAHAAAHGFVRGRSVASYVAAHTGKACVLRLDVEDCFASLHRGRVRRVFLNAGYPEPVADALARLCTVATPEPALQLGLGGDRSPRAERLRAKLRRPHLPQGAPTSPALANLCLFGLDARLAGLARRFAADYSRYADDLLFSGGVPFRREAWRCEVQAAAILLDCGLDTAHHKTRRMTQGQPQRAGGLTLNVRPNLARRDRERLEAILHNCVRHGPSTQDRGGHPDFRSHLQGCVAHAAPFDRTGRLQRLFAAIDWSA